jgi:hypothetical protein
MCLIFDFKILYNFTSSRLATVRVEGCYFFKRK